MIILEPKSTSPQQLFPTDHSRPCEPVNVSKGAGGSKPLREREQPPLPSWNKCTEAFLAFQEFFDQHRLPFFVKTRDKARDR